MGSELVSLCLSLVTDFGVLAQRGGEMKGAGIGSIAFALLGCLGGRGGAGAVTFRCWAHRAERVAGKLSLTGSLCSAALGAGWALLMAQ